MKKMTFNGAASVLNENEMQNVMAGSGPSGASWACFGLMTTASAPWIIGFAVAGGPIGLAGSLVAGVVFGAVSHLACSSV